MNYNGTKIDVQLGDHIIYRGFLWGSKKGRVCYIPGKLPENPEMLSPEGPEWGIELENGDVLKWLYLPDAKMASSRICFIRRKDDDYAGLDPDADLQ